jgi:hypothetical protein
MMVVRLASGRIIAGMAGQLVDSDLATTREFWRAKYFGASAEEARDERPFSEVLAERPAQEPPPC